MGGRFGKYGDMKRKEKLRGGRNKNPSNKIPKPHHPEKGKGGKNKRGG